MVSKKAAVPSLDEINENLRSRSAKLRYAVRNNNSLIDLGEFKNKFLNYSELESASK